MQPPNQDATPVVLCGAQGLELLCGWT